MDDFKSRGPELLTSLAAHTSALLLEHRVCGAAAAELIGMELAMKMAGDWGGQNIYVPSGLVLKLTPIYVEIYGKFTGHNQSALAREYGMSVQWIYQIVKRMRARDRTQGTLFDDRADGDPEDAVA